MITYSVAQVESLSGISAHSLRVWERRYDFIKPHRTETNIRYYSDLQLKKLINVGILLRHDYKISQVAKMEDDQIHTLVKEILLKPDTLHQEEINALVLSMIDLDEQSFDESFNSYSKKHGLINTFIHLIYPFLQHVGVLWGINKAMPAQEHFISNLIRQKLIAATEALPSPPSNAPILLLFLFEGEDHEIGLLLANYIAKQLGWHTYYLGANVPIENIKTVANQINPDLMFTLFVAPRSSKFLVALQEFVDDLSLPMIYSGSTEVMAKTNTNEHVIPLAHPSDLTTYLKNFNKAE